MNTETQNIPQILLWENLKDKINSHLSEIKNKTLQERYLIFNTPPFREIQDLLEEFGKELFKIILHETIVTNLPNKDIDSIINDFSFFLYPGYTTLKNRHRVFIEGLNNPLNNPKQKRLFSGIGVKKLSLKSISSNSKYNNKNEQIGAFVSNKKKNIESKYFLFDGSLYYNDNPSTIAFNNLLNQYYFDEDYPKSEYKYQVGQTHSWNRQQIYLDSNNNKRALPIRLKDDTKFRMLLIGIQSHDEMTMVSSGNGLIKIKISNQTPIKDIGQTISKHLSKKNIPVKWESKKHKNQFVNWCYAPPINFDPINDYFFSKNDLYNTQVIGYSYWLNETFNINSNNDYSYIKNHFRSLGYDHIAENRIISYQEYINIHKENTKKSYEAYFNNWYTIFLENFDVETDLGSLMIMSNHELSSEFLYKLFHWGRWIFNELRMIESDTMEKIEGAKNSIKLVKHSQNHFIEASKFLIKKDFNSNDKSKVLELYLDLIAGYVDMVELVELNENDTLKSKLINQEYYVSFNLLKIIYEVISVTQILVNDTHLIRKTIKGIRNLAEYQKKLLPILLRIEKSLYNREIIINQPIYPIALIIKELFINAMENIDITNPFINIDFSVENDFTIFKLENSVKNVFNKKEIFEKIHSNKTFENRAGWRMIFRTLDILNLDYKSSPYNYILKNSSFYFEIKIPVVAEKS